MMDQYSPKASPLGSHSPSIQPVDTSGLKMTISLKQKSPFYLMRPEALPFNETTGATNLMAARGLEHSYNKLTTKKMKDNLSSFLVNLPGKRDIPGSQDNSSLRSIIDKPPVGGKEIHLLTNMQLQGFRLHPGPLPEQYRESIQMQPKRKKQKKHKYKINDSLGLEEGGSGGGGGGKGEEEREKKREKKHKRHEKDADERKKKKKEKKKKKNKEDKEL